MEATFSDDEKVYNSGLSSACFPMLTGVRQRFVLGEIIKVSAIEVPTLVDFIKSHRIQPNWMSMQLPGGRNMNQCIGAVENMFDAKFPPPNFSTLNKRKSLGNLIDHPAKRQAIAATLEPPLAPIRAIQPRPPLAPPRAPPYANGYLLPVNPIPAVPISGGTTTTGKKRGRPSKADKEAQAAQAQAQAQARAASARPTEYAYITPAPLATPIPTPASQPREYASPGYELASNGSDSAPRTQPGPTITDSPRQGGGSLPLASPALTAGAPRSFSAPSEPLETSKVSPQDQESVPMDSRPPPLPPLSQHTSEQSQTHAQSLPRPKFHSVPTQPLPRPQSCDPYRVPDRADPIFPDRDRSSSMSNQTPKGSAPASPLINRT
ncbi:hypothetical protein F5Y17DRAFT_163975 [Xylariaceae sp. FL0594]|nr:hypothetical protein F5Y17DRAFT_163975 [Xylariaceae sp. FL0594]